MSVFRAHGPVKKVGGVAYELAQEVKKLDLRPLNRVTYTFDPFHATAAANFRRVMHILSAPKVRDTNYKCIFKTEVVCDNSEPVMLCVLGDGRKLKFEAGNLTPLELLSNFNRIVIPLLPPPEDPSAATAPKTKSQKKR